jgi:U2-associated protein SR140
MTERSYRDEVSLILKVWQDEHLFDESTLSHLDEAFNARERQKEEEEQTRKLVERRKRKGNIVRKTTTTTAEAEEEEDKKMDLDEGESEAATPGTDAGVVEETTEPTPQHDVPKELPAHSTEPEIPGETAAARARRLRPKAEDMFASDEE